MAVETLRANKLRSALTVLGIVIGITSIVGVTSLIRGFDESLRSSIMQMGPNTVFVARFSGVSFSSGASFAELVKRPNLHPEDALALVRQPSVHNVDVILGDGGPPTMERIFHRNRRTKEMKIIGTTSAFPDVMRADLSAGRFFTESEVHHRTRVVVLGESPRQALFEGTDPIGKTVRIGTDTYTVVGVAAPRPSLGGMSLGQDDFAVIPQTSYQRQFGLSRISTRHGEFLPVLIAVVPREGMREQALREVEETMRIRHGLRLDQPNDFDLINQDAALQVWDKVTGATFLALVAISSIALMVGGIGVMAIMTISVTERTREIGIRKALGARRREILWQFLLEAVFLTLVGGVLGILMGSAIGVGVSFFTKLPVSLPLWSFALGLGLSATLGI